MDFSMMVVIGSVILVGAAIYLHDKPAVQQKIAKSALGKASKKKSDSVYDEKELGSLRETAEEFLDFDTINKGMISFKKDPNYFTMAFGVTGINIGMYSSQERVALKSGFTNILNSWKEETQILLQSRYVDLSKNFEYYKPVIDNSDKERDLILQRIKTEKSEVVKRKLIEKAEKLKQRNLYANHMVDFFNYYTKQSDCIYIKIFVIVSYRYTQKGLFNKKESIAEEAYNALINKVKILREQFESIKLKTYELDSIQTANIIYSAILKNESSYTKLEDAAKNGLLDLIVENPLGEETIKVNADKYKDDYEYDHYDEAAATEED